MERGPIEALWAAVRTQTGRPRGWHINNLFNHEWRYRADLRLIDSLVPAGTILEIGSAPCHMTALLKLTGHAAVGVDVAPERVADFIDRFGLDVRRCDIERSPLPFDDDAFAGVMLCDTFEHLRIDPAFVLSEINRVMAPGAVLLFTTPNVYSLPSLGRFLLGRSIADPQHRVRQAARTRPHGARPRIFGARGCALPGGLVSRGAVSALPLPRKCPGLEGKGAAHRLSTRAATVSPRDCHRRAKSGGRPAIGAARAGLGVTSRSEISEQQVAGDSREPTAIRSFARLWFSCGPNV